MEFDDEDLPMGEAATSDASRPRPNTSRGGSDPSARTGSAERPKTSYKNPNEGRPYSRANSAYGSRPVTSGRLGSAVGHAGGGYTAR